jgi:hypothetical protein
MQVDAAAATAAAREKFNESARDLRDLAQQCYLLLGLTDDPWLKSHLLELGVGLEQRIRRIES